MAAGARFCTQCGAGVPEGVRFCVMCGAKIEETPAVAAPPPAQPQVETGQGEWVVGHLPVERVEQGAGAFGRTRSTQLNMVITSTRLLYLRETEEMNELWVYESERLEDLEKRSGLPLRVVMHEYDWHSPQWASLYATPPDQLLAAHRHNEAVPLAAIVSATVTLAEELDQLDLDLASGERHHFLIYVQAGEAAGQFLSRALGAGRVRLIP